MSGHRFSEFSFDVELTESHQDRYKNVFSILLARTVFI